MNSLTLISIAEKKCTACLVVKPISTFGDDGKHSHCNKCKQARRSYNYLPVLKPSDGLCPLVSKRCTKCKTIKPIDSFKWRRAATDAFPFRRSECTECNYAYRRARWRTMSDDVKQERYRQHREYMKTPRGQELGRFHEAKRNSDVGRKALRMMQMRATFIQRRYGITIDEYMRLFDAQNGVCQICEQPPLEKELAIDHDHATGEIRGLLCDKCNLAIGLLRDSSALCAKAESYLLKFVQQHELKLA